MQKNDGMNYAPKGKPNLVVQKGEFIFAAIALDHGHIYGMCNGLLEAGAELKWVYDQDPAKVAAFRGEVPSGSGCCFRRGDLSRSGSEADCFRGCSF